MAKLRPLEVYSVVDIPCLTCGREDYVLTTNVKDFPPTCIICLMRLLDEPMEWKLSNHAIQTLAQRAHAADEQKWNDRIEEMLPPSLRKPKA